MVDANEILENMKLQMEEYKKQYNDLGNEIETLGKEYQSKIDALQQERLRLADEGNAKLDQLKLKREQISGMHAGLYAQYTKYTKSSNEVTPDTQVQSKSDKSDKPKTPEIKKKNVTKKTTQSQGLSEAEKETLAKIVANESATSKDANGNDIPEYLQEEYNK